jgi:hypothetical protein
MKRLFTLALIIGGSLFASAAYSQVYVHARINVPLPPIPHVTVSVPSPAYYGGYNDRVVVTQPAYGGYYDRDNRYYDRDGRYNDRDNRYYGRGHDDWRRNDRDRGRDGRGGNDRGRRDWR